jgi:two-component system, OmpR family, KDP operon response regulator KdpE
MVRILVIDDEPQIRRFLRISLSANGYETIEAGSGGEGLAALESASVDLVILDLGLPDLDGQEVITAIHERFGLPIIVLSVRSREQDKVEALERGACDYVVKPFGIAELIARIRAVLRQRTGETPSVVSSGTVSVDLDRRIVLKNGREVRLSRKEYDLLATLARRPDHVLTHAELLSSVWGNSGAGQVVYLRVYIKQLREKLEDDPNQPRLIVTDSGIGYRFRLAE